MKSGTKHLTKFFSHEAFGLSLLEKKQPRNTREGEDCGKEEVQFIQLGGYRFSSRELQSARSESVRGVVCGAWFGEEAASSRRACGSWRHRAGPAERGTTAGMEASSWCIPGV
uniref:Uncharacterized protein n=1 Tax=Oryza punctata TaxID=4537 RepID=A0A0E0LYF6_ORYPU